MNKKITIEKKIAIILGCVSVLSIVPLLIIACYNQMCADDYCYGLLTHKAWLESHSVINTLYAAIDQVKLSWNTWQGTYSAIFLMALQPGIFSEETYFLSTYIILFFFIGGVIYFSKVLFKENCGMGNSFIVIILSIFFFYTIQWIPVPSQAFYWYNGSIYYVAFYGIMMFYFGMLIKVIITDKCKPVMIAGLLAVAMILGGGNYITALITVELECIFVIVCWIYMRGRMIRVFIPTIMNCIGFFISVMAPGNQVRQQNYQNRELDALSAILYSISYSIKAINQWMNIWLLLGIALLIPFIWTAVAKLKCDWKYPGGVIILSFFVFASSFAPTFYAMGSEGPGRVKNLQYVYFISMVFFDLFYIEGWLLKRLKPNLIMSEKNMRNYVNIILVCLVVSLVFMSDEVSLISHSAEHSLSCGEAKIYKQEAQKRIDILQGSSEVAKLSEFTVRPYVLYFDDITNDESDWRNQGMAQWYGKSKVIK